MIKKISVICLSLFVSACSTTSNIENEDSKSKTTLFEEDAVSISSFNNVVFKLKTIDGGIPPVQNNLASISFTRTKNLGDIIRGNTGCNLYYTKYKTIRSVLITDNITSTDTICEYDQMQLEGFFFKIYSQKPIISFSGELLKMKTLTNVLIFEKEKNDIK